MISWGIFPDGMTGLSCNTSQTLSVWIMCTFNFTRLFRGITFYKMSSSESLDLQSKFKQQIALEVIRVQGYNHCLYNRSIGCQTATKSESFVFSITCLALANVKYFKINEPSCHKTSVYAYDICYPKNELFYTSFGGVSQPSFYLLSYTRARRPRTVKL